LVYSIGGGDMITNDWKILEDSGYEFNKWTQLAVIMIEVGIIEDIIKFADTGVAILKALTLEEWEQLYYRWRNNQIISNPQVEKLNRGQFYIGRTELSNESGIFYVNPLSREEWESNFDVGLIYFDAKTVALLCKDEQENKGKKMTERTPLLKKINIEFGEYVSYNMGYNTSLADVTILNEPDENGHAPWSMGYNQSFFESEGWEFYPVSFEVKTETKLGVFNWWW